RHCRQTRENRAPQQGCGKLRGLNRLGPTAHVPVHSYDTLCPSAAGPVLPEQLAAVAAPNRGDVRPCPMQGKLASEQGWKCGDGAFLFPAPQDPAACGARTLYLLSRRTATAKRHR